MYLGLGAVMVSVLRLQKQIIWCHSHRNFVRPSSLSASMCFRSGIEQMGQYLGDGYSWDEGDAFLLQVFLKAQTLTLP